MTASPFRRLFTLLGLLVAVGLMPTGVALAATNGPVGRIVSAKVQPTSDGAQVTAFFEAAGLPTGTTISPSSVTASVGGTALPATATVVGQGDTSVQRIAILAMDTSGSMNGAPIAAAKAAASQFLASVPASVRVGLVTFADRPQLTLSPTLDRIAVRAAINRLSAPPNGGTALYDGVRLAVASAGSAGIRQVLVLSDGADDGSSQATLADATNAIGRAQVVVDAVSLGAGQGQLATLKTLTAAGKGQVVATAQASNLSTIFVQSANAISNQLQVLVDVPTVLLNSQQLTIEAYAGTTQLSDTVFVPLLGTQGSPSSSPSTPAAAGPIAVTAPWYANVTRPALWSALGVLFLSLAILLGVALRHLSGDQLSAVDRRIAITLCAEGCQSEESESTSALGDSAVARSAVDFAGRVAKNRDVEVELAQRLARAAVPLQPGGVGDHPCRHYARQRLARRTAHRSTACRADRGGAGGAAPLDVSERAVEPAAERLQRPAGGHPAAHGWRSAGGLLPPQAVDSVVREGADPIAGEFNHALVETRLGVPIEDALAGIGERMDSTDFRWTVMAIRIQREVGGNLAEVLRNVASTLRERERLRRQVRVLSAEGRLSAWIIGLLPFIFAVFLALVRPGYLSLLFTTSLGLVMLTVGLVLFIVGVVWLRRVVRVEY